MSREKYKTILRNQFSGQPRYCTSCCQKKPREGGREVVMRGGLRQRWVCGDCGSRHAPMGNA